MTHKDKDICALLEAFALELAEMGHHSGSAICSLAVKRITSLNGALDYYQQQDAAKAD